MENITRIADLPDNINGGVQNTFNPNMQQPPVTNGYVPINVHPNPYGISAQNPIMDPPIHQQPMHKQQKPQYISEENMVLLQTPQQRLPSRDIPNDQSSYTNDEEVIPNYISKPKQTISDYVREHEDMTERNLREYEEKNRKEKKLDLLLTEFQTPIFVMILFFLFQLPMINTLVFKRFSFLSIYNTDGNFNFNGLLLKSILFGFFYYSTTKITTFLSEF